jgi:hypothetical protein
MLRDILQVAEHDYLHVLRSIAAQEIGQQVKLRNPPSGMLVDGTRNKGVDAATRSVVAWFADRVTLADAIIAARNALERNGRRVTGATLGALRFYHSTGKGGALQSAGDIRSVAMSAPNPAALNLYVSLPLKQVRKWQWFGRAGSRLTRRTRNKALVRYAKAMKAKPMNVSLSVFELSAKQTQRQFRSVDVRDIYISVPDLNTGGGVSVDRIPAIKVCQKIRGRGR